MATHVSGDRSDAVALVVADGSNVVALLRQAARIRIRQWALVGGLAVIIRLAGAHRATTDLDAVLEQFDDMERCFEVADRTGTSLRTTDGMKVDGIEVAALPADPAELPDDPFDRLFLLAHRWAFERGEPMEVGVTVVGGISETVRLPVAPAGALLGCKCVAAQRRPRARQQKRASDLLDLYRLVDELSPTIAADLATSPVDAASLIATEVHRRLDDEAERTARLVQVELGVAPTPAQLRVAAARFDAAIDAQAASGTA